MVVQQAPAVRRVPLSRDRVLRAAVALADAAGIESLNMRKLAQELGVVPMALYKHVANKDELARRHGRRHRRRDRAPGHRIRLEERRPRSGFSRRDEPCCATPGPRG